MIDHADNIFDRNAILHPGSVYGHPRDVVVPDDIGRRKARHPRILGIGCRCRGIKPGAEGTAGLARPGNH